MAGVMITACASAGHDRTWRRNLHRDGDVGARRGDGLDLADGDAEDAHVGAFVERDRAGERRGQRPSARRRAAAGPGPRASTTAQHGDDGEHPGEPGAQGLPAAMSAASSSDGGQVEAAALQQVRHRRHVLDVGVEPGTVAEGAGERPGRTAPSAAGCCRGSPGSCSARRRRCRGGRAPASRSARVSRNSPVSWTERLAGSSPEQVAHRPGGGPPVPVQLVPVAHQA